MNNTSDQWQSNGVCRSNAAPFQAAILDYNPTTADLCMACEHPISLRNGTPVHTNAAHALACPANEPDSATAIRTDNPIADDYALLSATQRAEHLTAKTSAENAAIDMCMGCPVMLQCEAWAITNPISGIVGGRTEAERNAIRAQRGLIDVILVEESPTALTDRGIRNQVSDEAVGRLTSQGRTSEDIARTLGCASRTVVRARHRNSNALLRVASNPALTVTPETAQIPQVALIPVAAVSPASVPVTRSAFADLTPKPTVAITTARRAQRTTHIRTATTVDAPMFAIYTALSDNQWHDRDSLVAVGVTHVTDAAALAWWTTENSVVVNGERVLRTGRQDTPMSKRITSGARSKVMNSLSASHRTQHRTLKGGPDGTNSNAYMLPVTAVPAQRNHAALTSVG